MDQPTGRSSLDAVLTREFPPFSGPVYLNHAGISRLPLCAVAAVETHAHTHAAAAGIRYPDWTELEARLRGRIAALVGAPGPGDIALVTNTSSALSTVAWGFPWEAGENVVTSNQEYPANRLCWESLGRIGVETRLVDLGSEPEAALLQACDARTRLLAVSAVEFASGLRLDLERLGEACQARGIAFCVDAIQALGVVPIRVNTARIDFLAAGAHKWLMGPEGLALFYCAPEWRDRLRLYQFGAHMTANPTDFDAPTWQPAADARRFECGTLNRLGMAAFDASLGLYAELGADRVAARVTGYADRIVEAVAANAALELVTPADPARRAGIVTFRRPRQPGNRLFDEVRARDLWGSPRAGGVRLSPHASNTGEEIDRVVEVIKSL